MAKEIVVKFGDKESTFSYKPVDRASLYGKRKRVLLDQNGEPCSRASLLEDGSLLLKSGMSAQGYYLPDGRSYKLAELEGFDLDGKVLEKVPSTLGVAQTLEEVSPEEALNISQQTFYVLDTTQIDEGLRAALDEGKIFRFTFNYREDYLASQALLVSNENGLFAIIGQPVEHEWVSFQAVVDLPPESEDSEEELDFEMF